MKLVITFGSLALVGANDGLDPEASGSAYAEELRRALMREWPTASIEVHALRTRDSVRAAACQTDDESARGAERLALDLT